MANNKKVIVIKELENDVSLIKKGTKKEIRKAIVKIIAPIKEKVLLLADKIELIFLLFFSLLGLYNE